MARTLKRRGAAMVEAVIALPVLVLLLIAVPYVHGLLATHQATLAQARADAWTRALSACDTDAASDVAVPGGDFATQAAQASKRHGNAEYGSALDVPVVGTALSAFVPRAVAVEHNQTVLRPKMLAVNHDEDSVEGRVDLVCNEPTKDPLDAALRLMWSFL
jgi:hypothetical protein